MSILLTEVATRGKQQSIQKGRNCLTDPSPRACRARQANHSNIPLNLTRFCSGFSHPNSKFAPKVTVSGRDFFSPQKLFDFYIGLLGVYFLFMGVCRTEFDQRGDAIFNLVVQYLERPL